MSVTTESEIFWGELAPCDHSVQIYLDDSVLLDTLEGFVAGGINAQDAVIVIATPNHRAALEARLLAHGFDLQAAQGRDQYIALDAEQALARFMVNDWPDEDLFESLISDLTARAGAAARRVRAFGEMVAILWANGNSGATVRLEHLWHKVCVRRGLSLFCAYPKSGFTQDADQSIREICETHSRVICGHRPIAV